MTPVTRQAGMYEFAGWPKAFAVVPYLTDRFGPPMYVHLAAGFWGFIVNTICGIMV